MPAPIKLSENFSLRELLWSDTAARDPELLQEQLNPPEEVVTRLAYLTQKVLQPLRDEIGWPIRVNSGYRCKTLNERVKGSATSQHLLGEAADLSIANGPGFTSSADTVEVRTLCRMLYRQRSGRPFPKNASANFYLFVLLALDPAEWDIDQVIHEFGAGWGRPAWIHVAASTRQDKRRITVVGRFTERQYQHYDRIEEAVHTYQGDDDERV